MNDIGKIVKRIVGTVFISFGLSAIMFPLLSVILIPMENISHTTIRIIDIILLIIFAIAGWNIMKKEEKVRAKILEKKNNPNQSSEPTLKTPGDSVDV